MTEVKYACFEMLDHMDLPYSKLSDLRKLKGNGDASNVLILPETSRVARAQAVRESRCSFLFTGYIFKENHGSE